jgi:hypothetical protein
MSFGIQKTQRKQSSTMQKSHTPSLSVILAVLVLLLTACAHVRQEKKTQSLAAATYAYGNALRWGYYETAWNYLDPAIRARISPEQHRFKSIRLTAYDVVQPTIILAENQNQAEQWVQIDYVHQDTQVVHSLTDHQIWRYDEIKGDWQLHSDPPIFH